MNERTGIRRSVGDREEAVRVEVHRCDVCRARLRYGVLGYRHAFALEQPRGTRVEVVDTCLSAYCMASAARVAEGRIS